MRIVFSISSPSRAAWPARSIRFASRNATAHYHGDGDGQVDCGDSVGELGEVEREDRAIEDLRAFGGGAVEHPAQRAVTETLKSEGDLAQLVPSFVAGDPEARREPLRRFAQLFDDIGDCYLGPIVRVVCGLQAGREADRLGLRERAAQHGGGDGLE